MMNLGPFLWGALTASCSVVTLFFLRFWTTSGDRLFAFFAAAFALFGVNWLALASLDWGPETRHHAYWFRLFGFVLIAAGIIDKNRRAARQHSSTREE
jgi:predicted small integral membrane protein